MWLVPRQARKKEGAEETGGGGWLITIKMAFWTLSSIEDFWHIKHVLGEGDKSLLIETDFFLQRVGLLLRCVVTGSTVRLVDYKGFILKLSHTRWIKEQNFKSVHY